MKKRQFYTEQQNFAKACQITFWSPEKALLHAVLVDSHWYALQSRSHLQLLLLLLFIRDQLGRLVPPHVVGEHMEVVEALGFLVGGLAPQWFTARGGGGSGGGEGISLGNCAVCGSRAGACQVKYRIRVLT